MDAQGLHDALLTLARNHRWTWRATAAELLAGLPGAEPGRHPVEVVETLDDDALATLVADSDLAGRVEHELASLLELGPVPAPPRIAYFSPEFGISELVPQYSGGLGILAGDHLKAASDLGVSLCGVGLFYRGGFFRQRVTTGQEERYEVHDPPRSGHVDTGVVVEVPMADRTVHARVWRLDVGRVALLVLDTDLEVNPPADRAITDRLYSGDRRHRLEQEMVLGVGGSRALVALGWAPLVHHLNEGHAAFLVLDLLDRWITEGASLAEAVEAIRPGLVFTTHTPVPAGIDRFEPALARRHLRPWARRWEVPIDDLMALGHDPTDDSPAFNMAALALRASGRAAGVSRLHGEVSRELFAAVPGGRRIGSVTNGVHARSWVAPRLQRLFDDVLGHGWADGDGDAWTGVDRIDDDTLRSARRAGAQELAGLVAERSGDAVDPDALIVGFARRFATYKRATLLLSRRAELLELLADDERPVQFVFAGKAHPADDDGKALLAEIVAFGRSAEARGRLLFVPDYDMAVARAMYGGCDVWLNTPIRPHEASGTSGEKAALNGVLNCSISDGWWDEMADGRNGWTIPSGPATPATRRDREEAAAALSLLAGPIRSEYHGEGGPWSSAWLDRVRHNWRSLGPRVTAARMLRDYDDRLYGPALADMGR